ncbi:hypothetical protein [Leptospira weilii]|uniref:Uncharacterized protein n=1 Tax=Leptospira weilii str. UI 13098 TaxID=1088542 RepID=M6QDG6_9LEPT|nr:hypothetical protein [Leptospira weilii]EMN91265.1 hypothetical protein LEP1GSC108_3248 [Leptospira weilii str. UI 13098]
MDKLSGIQFPTVNKRVFPEDWKQEQESKSNEIITRDMDHFGTGVECGGSIVIGSGANHVDLIDTLIAYDEEGKRIQIPATANIVVPNNTTCTIVARHKFLETEYTSPSNMPSDGPVIWKTNSFEIIARQGVLVSGDVPLRAITSNGAGVVTLGTDLRSYRGLQGHNLKDSIITDSKLDAEIKTGKVTELHTDIIAGINPDVNNPLKLVKGINQVYLFFKNFTDLTFKQERKFVGEMFWMDDIKTPSIDFPAFCLANPDQVINSTGSGGMPDLVTLWLNKPFRYDPLGTNVTDFDATSYTIVSNVLTVTFANTTACQKMIDALVEDNLVHGSFTNWMTGTLLQAIGAIPTNSTLSMTALSSASRTISFSCSASNSSGSLSGVKLRFYKHRVPDVVPGTTVTTQVRHFAMQGRGFVAVMDSNSDWIGGLRRRDRFQGHRHATPSQSADLIHPDNYSGSGTSLIGNSAVTVLDPIADASGNGTPRTGKTTDARGLSGFPYVFAKRVL